MPWFLGGRLDLCPDPDLVGKLPRHLVQGADSCADVHQTDAAAVSESCFSDSERVANGYDPSTRSEDLSSKTGGTDAIESQGRMLPGVGQDLLLREAGFKAAADVVVVAPAAAEEAVAQREGVLLPRVVHDGRGTNFVFDLERRLPGDLGV